MHTFHTWTEILSQPETWRATLEAFGAQREALRAFLTGRHFDRVVTIGCGSTHYLAQVAAAMVSRHARVPAVALPSSEVWLSPDALLPGTTLLLAISRSGSTTETVRAVERFRDIDAGPIIAVSCDPESALAQLADLSLISTAAQEQSIAQTRSFSSMLLLTQSLTAVLAGDHRLEAALGRLPDALSALVSRFGDLPLRLGSDLALQRFFYLGGGSLYGLACEAMLKMKEMTVSYAEAYHPLEFRHGPMSMVNDQTLVIGLVPDTGRAEAVQVLRDMSALGARVLAIAEDRAACGDLPGAAEVIELQSGVAEVARVPLYLPPLQHLAYHRAIAKGLDPDHPHHLSAVVSL